MYVWLMFLFRRLLRSQNSEEYQSSLMLWVLFSLTLIDKLSYLACWQKLIDLVSLIHWENWVRANTLALTIFFFLNITVLLHIAWSKSDTASPEEKGHYWFSRHNYLLNVLNKIVTCVKRFFFVFFLNRMVFG